MKRILNSVLLFLVVIVAALAMSASVVVPQPGGWQYKSAAAHGLLYDARGQNPIQWPGYQP